MDRGPADWVAEWEKFIKDHPDIPHDADVMLVWFCNIYGAGYDAGRRDDARKTRKS